MADPLAEFHAFERQRGPRCTVGLARRALPPAELAKLDLALTAVVELRLPQSAVSAWLKQRNIPGLIVGREAVGRHVNGECRCQTS